MGSLVSLVMSDIVDSTRRWNAAEGAMAADLELHDRLIRDVVEGAGGSVFKHTGDGMIAVFDDPVAAAGAAAGIQQAIGTAQWQQPDGLRVRAAVHTGVVYPRDGDLFGTAVNKVARLLGVCPPGAVLVSGATTALLTDRAPEGLVLRSVGAVPLAGFATPDDAHALVGAGLAPVTAIGSSSAEVRSGLPRVDDELIGRTDELAAVWDAVDRSHLITLVGVGGMGKTRLALEVAAGAEAAYDGAVWWIDLANATSPEAVVPVAMAAIGVHEAPGRTPLQALCDRLASVRAMVVVDNCEHVHSAARDLVSALRSGAPEVRMLATSREALGLRGEHLVPIGSLPSDDGARLFAERALAVRPSLDIEANRAVIERICTRLDGIPLAIELAAARCRSINPEEVDERLDDRFRLLRGGRDGAERHRTLQATVAWSYEMLDPDERAMFHQMAVFAGGTLIDGLTAVSGFDDLDVIDIVDRLVARSMVVASDSPLGTRYHQLETLRQFAEDRLIEAGSIGAVRDRHLSWAHSLATWIGGTGATPLAADGFRRFCAEVDNLRVAVAHAAGEGHHHVSHEIVAAIAGGAYDRPVFEVLDWVRPIQLDPDWTDAAAECVAWGAAVDMFRGIRPDDGPVGGVPERFLLTNPTVAARHAYVRMAAFNDRQAAHEVLERAPVNSDRSRLTVDGIWLLLQFNRQYLAQPGPGFDEEVRTIVERGREALALARRTGDELAYGSIAQRFAWAIDRTDPHEAIRLAAEALAIGERLGASTVRDYARIVSYRARIAIAVAVDDREAIDEVARDLRMAVVDALTSGNIHAAAALTINSFRLLARVDREEVLTASTVFERELMIREGLHLRLERAGVPVPDDWEDRTRRASALTARDAIELLVTALDRLIAEAAADGGEG